tara:strand:- start:2179 stop:3519 length:1341 start_codon:yes stop_codon:yes gene_type:complete
MSIQNILNDIAKTSSRLEKEAILESEKQNNELWAVVKATYDPFTQYYVSGVVDVEENTYEPLEAMSLLESIAHLGFLSRREKTGHDARDYVARVYEALNDDDKETFKKILARDLRIGCSTKTFNKIWPNMIKEYPCMLATAYSEKAMESISYPAYSQTKMDGMRCNVIVHADGKVEVRSRQGKLFETHHVFDEEALEIRNILDQHNEGWYVVLDGELIARDEDGRALPRQISNGICNKANKGTINGKEASTLSLIVWDYIPEPVFEGNVEDPLMYQERFDNLYELFAFTFGGEHFSLVESIIVNNIDEAREHYSESIEKGEEGTIVKDFTFGWKNERSKSTVKFKEIKDLDLRVTDWTEGTGKNTGLLGALTAETSDGKIRVNVGTGFSDQQRKLFTREFVMGRIIEIEYNQRISSANSSIDSLFLPRFIELREDKDVANSSEGVV